jgi:AraC-like DNA-binding protein
VAAIGGRCGVAHAPFAGRWRKWVSLLETKQTVCCERRGRRGWGLEGKGVGGPRRMGAYFGDGVCPVYPYGGPSIRVAAEVAGLSPRTLQRRLAAAGTSYSDLLAAARLRMAKQWLAGSSMSIAEIAASLGYREASNFARGFRRITGFSPTAWREMSARAW